jgi:ribonuclease Z
MKVTILGNNSALPAFGRHPTSQVVTVYGETILVDCGEGTQAQMQRYGIRWRNMHHLFISHLHGDHYFGLPGLLTSMSLLGRTSPLFLYGPAALKPIIQEILRVAATTLSYPLNFYPLPSTPDVLVDNAYFSLTSFPVRHRIDCWGLLVKEKTRGRKLLADKCRELGIPSTSFERIKAGEDYVLPSGERLPNSLLTIDGPKGRAYAYCADTVYTESFLDVIHGADTIYHECTYLEEDKEKAGLRFHSTASQAAQIALKAGSKRLLLGHFSSKYKDLDPFREEACAVFPESQIAEEGMTYEV